MVKRDGALIRIAAANLERRDPCLCKTNCERCGLEIVTPKGITKTICVICLVNEKDEIDGKIEALVKRKAEIRAGLKGA